MSADARERNLTTNQQTYGGIATCGDGLYWDAYSMMDPTQTTHQVTVTFKGGQVALHTRQEGLLRPPQPPPQAPGNSHTIIADSK